MNAEQVLAALKSAGTAQTMKTYRRHGIQGDIYGVSYTELGKLRKKLKVNQPLAQDLWASGNYDARVLATMVGDPAAISEATLDSWSRDLDSQPLADAFGGFVARTPYAMTKMKAWMSAGNERLESVGWRLLSDAAMTAEELPDSFFEDYLQILELSIDSAKNRVRYAMNGALIAIGLRNASLGMKAIVSARKIGKVVVDHGDTNCRTPDAETYILKAKARKKA